MMTDFNTTHSNGLVCKFFLLVLFSFPSHLVYGQDSVAAPNSEAYRDWQIMRVPGTWDEHSGGDLREYDGFGWYRCGLTLPKSWRDKNVHVRLEVGNIDNAHEVYFNGTKLGGAGLFPPNYTNGLDKTNSYPVATELIRKGDGENVVAIRVYDHDGRGGFKSIAPLVIAGEQAIAMNGRWEFRIGDSPEWASGKIHRTDTGIFYREMTLREARSRASGSDSPLSPEEALKTFTVADDFELSLVLSEPEMTQPVFFNFDEHGRMWVMNYVQYPNPAGLKMLSRDDFWRSVYDKVPQAPPNHARGADKITIHEDTNGDGKYDLHKTFVDGLSIASSFARGRGGVWVLNPPFLLFYPDANGDDVPDGDPQVHLKGFGIEDTHSVANSLRWGPDGWLYAAQGSTVTGNVVVVAGASGSADMEPEVVRSLGQLIWRYHPERHDFEIFAEGGGNAFGVEFDRTGALFSGHNGGDTRGFHYVQGGYYRKGFGKHGPLSNPYAFGYFEPMTHHSAARFTHNFVIYESDSFSEKYRGNLFGVEPMQGRIVRAQMTAEGSSFQTEDLDRPVISDDSRFRPVDIKVGPDGALYFADFYEPQISHREHFAGQVEKDNGRIYRLGAKGSKLSVPADLTKASSHELWQFVNNPNTWVRQTALRLLYDRSNARRSDGANQWTGAASQLLSVEDSKLENLWAEQAMSEGRTIRIERAVAFLRSPDPVIQAWAVRLIGDQANGATPTGWEQGMSSLIVCAANATDSKLRSQLASTAKRLPSATGMKVIRELLLNGSNEKNESLVEPDIHVPMLIWWAIEEHCSKPEVVIETVRANPELYSNWTFLEFVAPRLMRRFAATGKRADLEICSQLLELVLNAGSGPGGLAETAKEKYLDGFELAFKGRSLADLPERLGGLLTRAGGGSELLKIRRGDQDAIDASLRRLVDDKTELTKRVDLIQTLGEVRSRIALPTILKLFDSANDEKLESALLIALQNYSDAEIGQRIVSRFDSLLPESQSNAVAALTMRKSWTMNLLDEVATGKVAPEAISKGNVRRMMVHDDTAINLLVAKHWPELKPASSQELQLKISNYFEQLTGKPGDPYAGRVLFKQNCGKCHQLFGDGGNIGPDLTAFNRDDTLSMLNSVVDPSSEIREGFENYTVLTEDGRVVTGFIADQDSQVLVLRNAEGQSISIEQKAIEDKKANEKSVMPEGLLDGLSESQVSDLFSFLRSSQPLNR